MNRRNKCRKSSGEKDSEVYNPVYLAKNKMSAKVETVGRSNSPTATCLQYIDSTNTNYRKHNSNLNSHQINAAGVNSQDDCELAVRSNLISNQYDNASLNKGNCIEPLKLSASTKEITSHFGRAIPPILQNEINPISKSGNIQSSMHESDTLSLDMCKTDVHNSSRKTNEFSLKGDCVTQQIQRITTDVPFIPQPTYPFPPPNPFFRLSLGVRQKDVLVQ